MRMTSLAAMIAAATVALTAGMGAATAQSGLHNETDINQKLLIVSVADKINRACDSIGARYFKAHAFVKNLKAEAESRGYSSYEIDRYIEDKANRAEMRKRRNAYFKSKGASNLDPQSLCVLGRAEISQNTQIGVLLKAK